MPLYEYQCQDCETPFEALVTAARQPECPSCHGKNLEKLLSSPGIVGASSARPDYCAQPARPTCGGGRCGCH